MNIKEIGRFKDDFWPFEGYTHIRYTARALLENEEGRFGFLHIQGEDLFGKRNHLETVGGGIEEGEYADDAIVREVLEETGYQVTFYELVGAIIDTYNLIGRITYSTFFHCRVNTADRLPSHRTEEEQILIKEVVWLTPQEAVDWLENKAESNCDKIVQRRDALALRYYLENMKKENS